MKVLVTGASGFVGAAIVRRLLAAGHDVRALLRVGSPTDNIRGLEVETVAGDLLDHASLTRAIRGCDALFHCAADYRIWVRDPERMFRINVDGTRALMLAALEAGVRRVVYTSSVATLATATADRLGDETRSATPKDCIGPYKRSKTLAEAEVAKLVAERDLPVVIVNPSTPVGPNDIKPTPTGRILIEAAAGRMPAFVDTGLNVVHVDDVADGHLLALDKGRPGERYILGGENMRLSRDSRGDRRPVRAEAAHHPPSACGVDPRRPRCRGVGAPCQARPFCDPGRLAHGPQADVLLEREGPARTRIHIPTGARGHSWRGRLFPPARALPVTSR